MKVVIISALYPGPDNIYGDAFVHTRAKEYLKYFDVEVVGFNPNTKLDRSYNYEGIKAFITADLFRFEEEIKNRHADLLVGHLVQRQYLSFLLDLRKPLVIFFHGYEVLSWKRRLMNYDSVGSVRYLVPYIRENRKQRKKLREFLFRANQRSDIRFIFVSHWLHNAAVEDLDIIIKNSSVIPNGIDTSLFSYAPKLIELRNRILLLRSFKANNYGNDIAIKAILLLSKKSFFSDLKFQIQGEGYLFNRLTSEIKNFKNVELCNYFVENRFIPQIHKEFGIFLCPSRLDTQGVSMCEAMASGLVPITSPIGGIPEYAKPDSAFLVNTAEEIAEKIEYLYNNPSVFQTMSEKARKSIVQKCALSNVTVKEIQLIQSLVTYP